MAMEMAKVFAYEVDFHTGVITYEPAHIHAYALEGALSLL